MDSETAYVMFDKLGMIIIVLLIVSLAVVGLLCAVNLLTG